MKRHLTWLLTLAFTLGLSRPLLAKARAGGGPLKEALAALKLTEEQKNKIKEIRKSSKDANQETHEALKAGRKAMQELMTGDGKKDEILAKFDSLQSQRNKMARARFEMMLAVRDVLTPDQRKQFREFLQSHSGVGKRFKKARGEEEDEE